MSDRTAFNWADPFLLDDQLTEDERMIRDAAAAFGKAELLPRIQEAYLSETTEPELFRLMGLTYFRCCVAVFRSGRLPDLEVHR